jgi:hypothetical protein
MCNRVALGVVGLALFGAACDGDPAQILDEQQLAVKSPDIAPTGRGIGTVNKFQQPGGGAHARTNGISYHGGPVITGGTKLYYIWYGNWGTNTATTILTDLAKSIGGSSYFNINTTYYNGSGVHVANSVTYGGSTTDPGTSTNLSDADILAIVSSAISSGRLPKDTSGVYLVLTAPGVGQNNNGFCGQYCGWHDHGAVAGSDIKYGFIGSPDNCPSACSMQTAPNGNAGADGMASIIAHELEEATTDPDLNAWFDTRGYENADKCAWTFGTTYTTANGGIANMKLGTRDFLIQRNWVNAGGGFCAVGY